MKSGYLDGSKLWAKAPKWFFEFIKEMYEIDSNIKLRTVTIMIDENSNQKQNQFKMNTAQKLSYDERFKQMQETDSYSVSQAMFRDTKDAIDLYHFLDDIRSNLPEEQQAPLNLAQADILAILLDKVDLTKEYVGLKSSPLDLSSTVAKKEPVKAIDKTVTTSKEKEVKVIQMQPDKEAPAAKKETTPEKQEVSGPLPFKDVANTCKELLNTKGETEAIAYATLYLGSGNYVPKKDKQKAVPWTEAKIKSWITDLVKAKKAAQKATKLVANPKDNTDIKPTEESDKKEENVEIPADSNRTVYAEIESKSNPLQKTRALLGYRKSIIDGSVKRMGDPTDKTTEEEKRKLDLIFACDYRMITEGFNDPTNNRDTIIDFSLPESSLTEETKALSTFATQYLKLLEKGSEDTAAAKDATALFFENRGYTEDQYNNWLDAVKKAEGKVNQIDHLSVLGTPKLFFPDGLTKATISQEDFIKILDDTDKCLEELSGKSIDWEPFALELHTDNHVFDYISKKKKEIEFNNKENAIDTYDHTNMLVLCETAADNDVSEEDFIKEHQDLLVKPNDEWRSLENTSNGYKVDIKNKADFEKWVKEIYIRKNAEDKATLETQKENGSVAEEKKKEPKAEDRRITILKSDFVTKVKSHADIKSLLEDSFVKDIIENGVVIDAYNDPDYKGTEIEYFEAGKKLKRHIIATFKTYTTSKNTKPDTFEDGSVRIYTFSQLKEEGDKLVKAGKTREELIDWVSKNIINRQLEDQPDEKQVYKNTDVIPNIVDTMFGFAEKRATEPEMTEEVGEDAINKMLKDEKMSLMQVTRAAKDIYQKMGTPKGLSETHKEILERAKEACPEKLKNHLAQTRELKEKKEKFVQEKFSKLHPKAWEELKDISSMDDLYNACVSYKDQDDWKVGLALALEIVPLGNIKEAKDWDVKATTDWYNTKVLSDPTEKKASEKKVVEEETEEEPVPEHLNDLMNAKNPKSFKQLLDGIVSTFEDTQEARKDLINAIKFGKGKHTRKISKMPETEIHGMINAAKTRVAKYKK